MSSIRGGRRRRRVGLAATALAACLALTATACNDDEDTGAEAEQGQASDLDADLQELIDNLPFDFDLEEWRDGGWEDWDPDHWLRGIGEFVNPIIEDLWDPDRMGEAEDPEQSIDDTEIDEDVSPPETDDPLDDRGVTDMEPAPIEAQAVGTPYTQTNPAVGKVFFDSPEGPMVCSGTVVADPNHPGQSNLVATAGHCVHAGVGGGWYRNIIFVPAYNPAGLSAVELEQAAVEDVAPFGFFWADYVSTTQYWLDYGSTTGAEGAHGDFAVLSVTPASDGRSLEETVGSAVPVDFDAPAVSGLGQVTLYGFPAAEPYDGALMYSCTGTPRRLSFDESMPVLYWVGCTMTGGSSGGPWLRTGDNGQPELISVNSIGPLDSTWLAGPRLDDEAEQVLRHVSEQAG